MASGGQTADQGLIEPRIRRKLKSASTGPLKKERTCYRIASRLVEMITGLAALWSALSHTQCKSSYLRNTLWIQGVEEREIENGTDTLCRRRPGKSGGCLPFIKVDFLRMPSGGGYLKMPLFWRGNVHWTRLASHHGNLLWPLKESHLYSI